MPIMKLAFDRTARRTDADGRLHIDRSHISKASINPYYGNEIPGFESLGLDPEKVYQLFRDPVELERAAPTFARLPILSKHVPVTVDAPRGDLVVGAIGSEIIFNPPYLDADLCIWDAAGIAGIETGSVRELSCAYRYVPIMEAGEYEGHAYDGKMTEIKGNHLALVEAGRAGSDVVVADQNPFTFKESVTMKMTKLGKALSVALGAFSPVLAADSATMALVGGATAKGFDRAGVRKRLLALDATLNAQQLDGLIDAIIGVEDDPMPTEPVAAAEDASPEEQVRSMLAGKVDEDTISAICAMLPAEAAADEFPDEDDKDKPAEDEEEEPMKKEDVKAAMDSMSAKIRADMREAEEARREVRPVVGDVVAMDSASEIYGFALDHLKVDRTDVKGVAALRAIFKVAANAAKQPVHIAQDSAGLVEKFPAANRFRQA